MWRAFVVGCMSVPLSIIVGVITSLSHGPRWGAIWSVSTFGICFAIALVIMLTTRRLSAVDLWLPVPIAVLWSAILSIFSLGAEVFTAPACIGSAILFSTSLWMSRRSEQSPGWTVLPGIVFMYEMLPINIPGPFDDYFAFGGTVTLVVVQYLMRSASIPGMPDRPQLPE